MNYITGICKDCKQSKCCISASRGLACNLYKSIKVEQERLRKAEQERILKFLRGKKEENGY